MRSTVRIDDDLMAALKARARDEQISLTRMLNRVLRVGLSASSQRMGTQKRYREAAVRMGRPRVEMDKALVLAAALEDEEITHKLSLRK